MTFVRFKAALLAPTLLALGACATIVGDSTQMVPITSTPSGAKVSIVDEANLTVFRGNTPTTVTLQKHNGSYFGKKSYVVTIEKKGFDSQQIPITASANGWYIGGNLLFGGLIGYLIVDPYHGEMYTLSPDKLSASLGEKAAHNNTADGGISVVLIESIPVELRDQLVLLHP